MLRNTLPVILTLVAGPAAAQMVDKYAITPDERAACQVDAVSYCSYTYPNEDSLIACMKENKAKLTPLCRRKFMTGLAKRHML